MLTKSSIVGSTEAPSKVFLLFFLFSDWLKSNRNWFLGIFSRHICSAETKTIRVTNCATSFGAKKCSENQVAEMILDPWNQQSNDLGDICRMLQRQISPNSSLIDFL